MKCPRCSNQHDFSIERRPNGDSICNICRFKGKTSEFRPTPLTSSDNLKMSKPMKPAREFWIHNTLAYDFDITEDKPSAIKVIEISAIQALTERAEKAEAAIKPVNASFYTEAIQARMDVADLKSQLAAKDSAITKLRTALDLIENRQGIAPHLIAHQALKETSGV